MALPDSLRPPLDERLRGSALADDLGFLIARANALSLAASNRALADYGLKVRSYSVLALAAEDTRPSQRELSEFLRLDPSQIVLLVDELEARGLVGRETDPSDRRAKVIVATDAGRELLARARPATRAAERTIRTGIDDRERELFADILRRIAYSD